MATPNKTRAWTVKQIIDVLNSTESTYEAAKQLGVSVDTLWRYMRKHNIKRWIYAVAPIENKSKPKGGAK